MVQPDRKSPASPFWFSAVRPAISKNWDRYAPTPVGKKFRVLTVGPKTNTKIASNAAIAILKFDSHWIPLPTPDIADSRNARVRTDTMPTVSFVDGESTKPEAFRPELICIAPKPSEHAVPKIVAKIAKPSMSLPQKPFTPFSPISGMKALESSCLRPRRNVEYAIARPKIA